MSRILWCSNAPWGGSGYGQQTALFARRLRAMGHDVALAANWGLAGTVQQWEGFTVFPSDNAYGKRAIGTWAELHDPDLIVFLCDSWVLEPELMLEELEPSGHDGVQIAVWAPVDHYPLPAKVFQTLDHEAIRPIAMSRFGCDEMRRVELDHLYVPHGVDTAVFNPRRETRDALRDHLGIPRDVFLVGMVAANVGNPALPRKSWPQAFLAFAGFANDRDDVWLYAHTVAVPNGTGVNLEELATMAGVPKDRLRFAGRGVFDVGLPDSVVSDLYQTFDVLLQPSAGEGFGVPILEAQACGVPVIVSKHSAMPELCGAGWIVDGQPLWDAAAKAWFYDPYFQSIRDALHEAYESRDDVELRARGVEFAQQYDANQVALEHWAPALAELGCASDTSLWTPEVWTPNGNESRQVRRARERREAKARGSSS